MNPSLTNSWQNGHTLTVKIPFRHEIHHHSHATKPVNVRSEVGTARLVHDERVPSLFLDPAGVHAALVLEGFVDHFRRSVGVEEFEGHPGPTRANEADVREVDFVEGVAIGTAGELPRLHGFADGGVVLEVRVVQGVGTVPFGIYARRVLRPAVVQ